MIYDVGYCERIRRRVPDKFSILIGNSQYLIHWRIHRTLFCSIFSAKTFPSFARTKQILMHGNRLLWTIVFLLNYLLRMN